MLRSALSRVIRHLLGCSGSDGRQSRHGMPSRRSRPRGVAFESLEGRLLLSVDTVFPAVAELVVVADINASQQAGTQSEVGIAVNPTNPLNIVAVANNNADLSDMAAYFSTDGGQTWTASFIDDTQDGQGATDTRFDPNVAFDSDGNAYVLYSLNTGGSSRLMLARSTDGGSTWAQSATVTTDGGANNVLHTASLTTRADPAGPDDVFVIVAHVVSGGEEIEAYLSLDAGATFPAVNGMLNDAVQRTFMPWAAADDLGNFHVTWEVDVGADGSDPEGSLLHDVLDGTTLASGTDTLISSLQITDFGNANSKIPAQPNRGLFSVSSIDVDRSGGPFDGRIYVSYSNRPTPTSNDVDIYLRYSDNDGAAWSAPIRVNDDATSTSQFMPRMSLDQSSGDIYAAWYDARLDTANNRAVNIFAAVSHDGGSTWSPNVRVSQEPSDVGIAGNNGNDYTEYMGLSAREGGAYIGWTDKRASNFGANREDVFVGYVAYAGQDVTVAGDLGGAPTADDMVLSLDASGTFVQVSAAGSVVFAQAKSALDALIIQGLGGDDTLTVDWSRGDPIPAGGLLFEGGDHAGAPGDRMVVTGSGAQQGTYAPDALAGGSGVVGVDGSSLSFSGLEPVTLSGFLDLTVITPNADDVLTLDSIAAGQNRLSGSSGGVALESLNFFDVASLVIDTGSNDGGTGADSLSVQALLAAGLQNLTYQAGAGGDLLTLALASYALPVAGGAFTYSGGSGDDEILATADASFTLSDTSLGISGGGSVALSSIGRATLTGGGATNSFAVENWSGQATLRGLGEDDAYTVHFIGAGAGTVSVEDSGGSADSLAVNGTGSADALGVAGATVSRGGESVTHSGIEELTVDTGDGEDGITVDGTGTTTKVYGGNGNDVFVVLANGPFILTLDGEEDSDGYTIGLGSLLGPVVIADSGSSGVDSLLLNGTPGDDVIVLTDTGMAAGSESITVSGIEQLVIDVGAGNDTVDGSALTIGVAIYGGAGDDLLIGGSNDDRLYGQDDNDDLVGNLGADHLDGGSGSDGLVGDCGTIVRNTVAGPASPLSIPGSRLQAMVNVPGTIRRDVTLIDGHLGGDDTLVGGSGDDYVHGGAGGDRLTGDDGVDALFGDAGDDELAGGDGDDHLYGGAGDDRLSGDAGADIAYGGDGDDRLVADGSGDLLIDWFGNFNDFAVPAQGFGIPIVVRSPSPWVRDFLLHLARTDGAADPNAELLVVAPGSSLQQANNGRGGRA